MLPSSLSHKQTEQLVMNDTRNRQSQSNKRKEDVEESDTNISAFDSTAVWSGVGAPGGEYSSRSAHDAVCSNERADPNHLTINKAGGYFRSPVLRIKCNDMTTSSSKLSETTLRQFSNSGTSGSITPYRQVPDLSEVSQNTSMRHISNMAVDASSAAAQTPSNMSSSKSGRSNNDCVDQRDSIDVHSRHFTRAGLNDEQIVLDLPKAAKGSFSTSLDGYRLLDVVGQGALGKVYRAKCINRCEGEVAIKVIRKSHLSECVELKEWAENEAQILSMPAIRDHPNIVTMYTCFQDAGNAYYVYEYLAEGSLAELLDGIARAGIQPRGGDSTPMDGLVPLDLIARWIHEILDLVFHLAQQGVVNRDIKPENVLLVNGTSIKMIDFDNSMKIGSKSGVTRSRQPNTGAEGETSGGGTVAYWAPERVLARNGTPLSDFEKLVAMDLWAVGCVLFKLTCGRDPFARNSIKSTLENLRAIGLGSARLEYPPGFPRQVRDVCDKLFALDPKKRLRGLYDRERQIYSLPFFRNPPKTMTASSLFQTELRRPAPKPLLRAILRSYYASYGVSTYEAGRIPVEFTPEIGQSFGHHAFRVNGDAFDSVDHSAYGDSTLAEPSSSSTMAQRVERKRKGTQSKRQSSENRLSPGLTSLAVPDRDSPSRESTSIFTTYGSELNVRTKSRANCKDPYQSNGGSLSLPNMQANTAASSSSRMKRRMGGGVSLGVPVNNTDRSVNVKMLGPSVVPVNSEIGRMHQNIKERGDYSRTLILRGNQVDSLDRNTKEQQIPTSSSSCGSGVSGNYDGGSKEMKPIVAEGTNRCENALLASSQVFLSSPKVIASNAGSKTRSGSSSGMIKQSSSLVNIQSRDKRSERIISIDPCVSPPGYLSIANQVGVFRNDPQAKPLKSALRSSGSLASPQGKLPPIDDEAGSTVLMSPDAIVTNRNLMTTSSLPTLASGGYPQSANKSLSSRSNSDIGDRQVCFANEVTVVKEAVISDRKGSFIRKTTWNLSTTQGGDAGSPAARTAAIISDPEAHHSPTAPPSTHHPLPNTITLIQRLGDADNPSEIKSVVPSANFATISAKDAVLFDTVCLGQDPMTAESGPQSTDAYVGLLQDSMGFHISDTTSSLLLPALTAPEYESRPHSSYSFRPQTPPESETESLNETCFFDNAFDKEDYQSNNDKMNENAFVDKAIPHIVRCLNNLLKGEFDPLSTHRVSLFRVNRNQTPEVGRADSFDTAEGDEAVSAARIVRWGPLTLKLSLKKRKLSIPGLPPTNLANSPSAPASQSFSQKVVMREAPRIECRNDSSPERFAVNDTDSNDVQSRRTSSNSWMGAAQSRILSSPSDAWFRMRDLLRTSSYQGTSILGRSLSLEDFTCCLLPDTAGLVAARFRRTFRFGGPRTHDAAIPLGARQAPIRNDQNWVSSRSEADESGQEIVYVDSSYFRQRKIVSRGTSYGMIDCAKSGSDFAESTQQTTAKIREGVKCSAPEGGLEEEHQVQIIREAESLSGEQWASMKKSADSVDREPEKDAIQTLTLKGLGVMSSCFGLLFFDVDTEATSCQLRLRLPLNGQIVDRVLATPAARRPMAAAPQNTQINTGSEGCFPSSEQPPPYFKIQYAPNVKLITGWDPQNKEKPSSSDFDHSTDNVVQLSSDPTIEYHSIWTNARVSDLGGATTCASKPNHDAGNTSKDQEGSRALSEESDTSACYHVCEVMVDTGVASNYTLWRDNCILWGEHIVQVLSLPMDSPLRYPIPYGNDVQ